MNESEHALNLIPYSLYLAHSALRFFFFKIALKCSIKFQLKHSENKRCVLRTAVMAVLLSEIESDAF